MEEIVVDPKIMTGKPVIRGTRIPVDAILKRIADGMTVEEILEEYIRGEDIIPIVKVEHETSSG
ncbi:MAG: DUF433 domain-containing protein [Candidatus Freyarchaeota archaeon]